MDATPPAGNEAPDAAIDQQRLKRRLILLLSGLIACAVLATGFASISAFERAVAPELGNRVQLIGSGVRYEVQRVVEMGIPIDAVAGIDKYISDAMANFDEIDRIELTDKDGNRIALAERADRVARTADAGFGRIGPGADTRTDLPILRGSNIVGNIAIDISPVFVETRLRDVFLDIGVLMLIAVLIAGELVLAVVLASVGKPLERVQYLLREQSAGRFLNTIRQEGLIGLRRCATRLNDHATDLADRYAALTETGRTRVAATIAGATGPERLRFSDFNDIRLTLFLFSAATEISVSFLPLFAADASRPDWLSSDLAAALPIVFYLGAIAALSPFGGRLARRFGARTLFLAAVPGATLALIGIAFSEGILSITLWHGAMAAFYSLATIAAQEYAIRAGGKSRSGAALGAFVAVIYGGLFFGSVLGGLIAGRFGVAAAFLTGAALAMLSLGLGWSSMNGRAGDRDATARDTLAGAQQGSGWFGLRYLVVLIGVAVPMNATMVIFVWYLTPLMLGDLGNTPADIVRVLLLYYMAILFLGPHAANLADARTGPVPLILAGATISGLALLLPSATGGFWAITAAAALVGVGQVLTATPLYTHVLRLIGGPGPGMDLLRLTERIGSIAALLASTALIGAIGTGGSLRLLSGFMLAGLIIFAIVELGNRQERDTGDGR